MAESVAPTESAASSVYQLRVVVAGVSPLIWRRLLVPTTTTIAELTRGAAGRVRVERAASAPLRHPRPGVRHQLRRRPGFRDDAHRVALIDLGLRATERFAYHYDFTDDWRLDLESGTNWGRQRTPGG